MISIALFICLLCIAVHAEDYYYAPGNVTRATMSGIQAYRSALTLDWLAAEDLRQRELVAAYETEPSAPARVITTECINFPRPSPGRVAKLMLELLKNLEGDDGILVPELVRVLVRSKMIVETSMLDSEPDLESLVKTPTMMMGEPHVSFPRILAIVWMLVTDTTTTRTSGWCPITKMNDYLASTKPTDIAKHLRVLEPVVARARFIMEEFIQNITPINMYQKKPTMTMVSRHITTTQEEPHSDTEVLAKLPRASGEHPVCIIWQKGNDQQKQLPNSSLDSLKVKQEDKEKQDHEDISTSVVEYPSTLFLEQAQQFAFTGEETMLVHKSVASHLMRIVYAITIEMLTLLILS